MLSTGRQSASDENETDPEPRQFHNWEGKDIANILLPDVEEEDSSSESSSGSDSESDPDLFSDVEEGDSTPQATKTAQSTQSTSTQSTQSTQISQVTQTTQTAQSTQSTQTQDETETPEAHTLSTKCCALF